MQINWTKKVFVIAALAGLQALTATQTLAQAPSNPLNASRAEGNNDTARNPTPRLEDGTPDLGGNGVWNQRWITDFARQMPGYQDGDLPPFLPWTRAMWEYNQATMVAYDPQGFCLPPGGPRAMGTPYPSEFIQQKDRIIIIFEGGGHVWREIHMDGREHPENLNPTYFGHSVGRWEGDTLVVDTVGFNERTWLDFGGRMHSDQLHTIEYFTRPYKEVLQYRAVIDDPGAYSEPWTVEWDIPWSEGQELADYICQENNQFLIDLHDDFGNPFFEKSTGL